MIDWLYSLPDVAILAIGAFTMAAAILILPSLTHRLPLLRPGNENTDFVLRMQATLFTMISLVLAFSLIETESNFRKVDALISTEASQINRLDRLLTRYDDPAAATIRGHLHAYAASIVQDEWPSMLRGIDSEKTRRALMPISRGILSLEPASGRETTIYGEILRSFDAVAESRDARINIVQVSLPPIYWQVVLFAVLMLLFISSTMERSAFRAYVLSAQMAVLGAFIGFVFIMDQPFKGESAVDAQPILQTIALMKARTN
jgi:hypothetical protein